MTYSTKCIQRGLRRLHRALAVRYVAHFIGCHVVPCVSCSVLPVELVRMAILTQVEANAKTHVYAT